MGNLNKSLEREGMQSKKMYHVEKFLPPVCPKCRLPFDTEVRSAMAGEKEEGDYSRLLGDIVDGQKVIRKTMGYDIIICAHCGNFTARYPLETYCVGDKAYAEKLIAEQGFQNLVEVQSFGTMARDHHAIISPMPGMRIIDAMDMEDDQEEE